MPPRVWCREEEELVLLASLVLAVGLSRIQVKERPRVCVRVCVCVRRDGDAFTTSTEALLSFEGVLHTPHMLPSTFLSNGSLKSKSANASPSLCVCVCVCARARVWVGVWTHDHTLSNSLLRRSSELPRFENDVDTRTDVCTRTRLIYRHLTLGVIRRSVCLMVRGYQHDH